MDVEVNLVAVLLAGASAMVIGSLWYSKAVFGKEWMKLADLKDEKKLRKEAPKSMLKAAAMAFLTAYLLSHIITFASAYYPARSEVSIGLTTAFWVWLGFVFAQIVMQDAFELRPAKLTMINVTYYLVSLLTMGWILSVVK